MDYFKTIHNSIDFMEKNLKEPISLEEIAKEASLSKYHFHRIFSSLTDDTVKSYLRKRRLSSAAIELCDTNKRILDIAIEYQFESQEAFSRSFKKMFGIAPGKCRKNLIRADLFDKIIVTKKGDIFMEPKYVEKDEMLIVGIEGRVSPGDGRLASLWNELDARKNEIKSIVNPNISIGFEDYTKDFVEYDDNIEFVHLCAFEVNDLNNIPKGMVGKRIPQGKYAKFVHMGPSSQCCETFTYIYGTWLPNTESNMRSFDYYTVDESKNTQSKISSPTEIFIPLK